MSNYSAAAIVNEFLRRRENSALPPQMFVQKLAYIANGWNLAVNGEPLIAEDPEAWDNGPVYRSLWDHIRDYGYRDLRLVSPASKQEISAPLTDQERSVVDHVWAKYGHRSATDLPRLTHEPGTPWFKAYFETWSQRSSKKRRNSTALRGSGNGRAACWIENLK